MYLPAKHFLVSRISIQTEEDDTGYEFVDAIVEWFVSLFKQLCESAAIQSSIGLSSAGNTYGT